MRRALLGYRRADVEAALGQAEADAGRSAELVRAQQARTEQFEIALEQTRQACVERDRRMAYLEAELDLARSDSASQLRGLAALGADLEELRVTARGQATRIRLDALREAAEVSVRARALVGAPEGVAESLLGALGSAIERLGSAWEEDAEPDAEPVPKLALAAAPAEPDALDELEAALDRRADPVADPVDDRCVLVNIGPFHDFSQLVSFEDAANSIEATSEISIRRFSEGRASIDVSLREPVDLLRELESRWDLGFEVRSNGSGELILDLTE
ncbi:MAG: hypothetical protein WBC01_05530 [Solirubrobacterales bacterium]